MKRFPAWSQPMLFAILSTGFASCLVAGIATMRTTGLTPQMPLQWMDSWLLSWPVAAIAMYFIAPHVRRFLSRICSPI